MFKVSRYNKIFTKDENIKLIYNTFSGAYGILNNSGIELLNSIENIVENKLTEEKKEIFNILKQNNFIIEDTIDEFELLNIRKNKVKYASKSLVLTIAPTMNCNMDCPYCYEKKVSSKMNEETINALKEFVEKEVENREIKYIMVNWYGGEPLLAMDVIKNLSEFFIEFTDKMNIKYSADMVSNGSLLNKDISDSLVNKYKVKSIQITLDGGRETTNERRYLKNNEKSFDKIINAIKVASESNLRVSVRVNVDKNNINEIDEVIEVLKENNLLNNKNVYLYYAPVIASTEKCTIFTTNCFSMKEFAEIDNGLMLKLYNNGIMPSYPVPKCIECGATSETVFVIESNGNLYRCWDEIENLDRCIGNVFTGIRINKPYIEWLSLTTDEKCTECDKLPICQGGCPYERIVNKNLQCHFKSINMEKTLEIIHTEHLKRKAIND